MANFRSARSRPAPTSIGFAWKGFDEMDEVSSDGSAHLRDDGSIEIEFTPPLWR
jgi:hypothetical protein